MDLNPYFQSNTSTAGREFPSFSRTRKLIIIFSRVWHCFSILGKMNSVYTLNPALSRSILILFPHLGVGFLNGLFHSEFAAEFIYALLMSRDNIVGKATSYGLDDRGVGVRVPVGSVIFFSPCHPGRLWGPPNRLPSGYRGLFPRG
jgi:hypothetical protein